MGAGVAVQHTKDAIGSSLGDHGLGIGFSVAGVNDDWLVDLFGQRELRGKDAALDVAGRVVVMIVESAFANGGCTACEIVPQRVSVRRLPFGGVVRVDTGGPGDDAWILEGELFGVASLVERGADANECVGASVLGSLDYRVAVAGEGRVREVAVAVDEFFHADAARGYLCSIQMSTGLAM